jgi:hypothetical protein
MMIHHQALEHNFSLPVWTSSKIVLINNQREENPMNKFATISTAALLAVSLSSAAFAQAGANPSAPQPNATGTGTVQPGMDKNGTATDAKMKSGTTGMNDKSGMGSKDSKDGMKNDSMKK